MLKEWSDRPPPRKPRPFVLSWEFWAGVLTALIGIILMINIAEFVLG